MFGRHQSALVRQPGEQGLTEGVRLFSVDPNQGCPGGALHAGATEPVTPDLRTTGDIPEASSAGKLASQHGEELAPAVEGPEFLPGMMHRGKRIEFISRNTCNQLFENSVVAGHGSELPGCYDLFVQSLYNQGDPRDLFSSIFMRQQ